jgi:dTDP-4-dehydrorhamnose reductase
MKLLVLGGAGMLGHKIYQTLATEFPQTFVTLRKPLATYQRFGIFDPAKTIDGLDARDEEQILAVLNKVQPDAVINCIGLTLRKETSNSAEQQILLNSLLPHRLNAWCERNSARLIHFSTDCVFGGTASNYTEASTPDARDLYGRSKMLGEVQSKAALVLRTSFIGRELEGKTELVEWLISQNGNAVKGFSQVIYTGITNVYAAKLVAILCQDFKRLTGLYQVASPPISKYELLLLLKKHFGLDIEIQPDDSKSACKKLDGSVFKSTTQITVPDWPQLISDLAKDAAQIDY